MRPEQDFRSMILLAWRGGMDILNLLESCGRLESGGQHALAAVLYQAWLKRNHTTHNHLVYFNLGATLTLENEPQGAEEAYREAIRLAPAFAQPRINLGLLLERRGDLEAALAEWVAVEEYLQAGQPDQQPLRLQALNHLGRALESAGRYSEAIAYLTKSLTLEPNQPDVIHHCQLLREKLRAWPVDESVGLVSPDLSQIEDSLIRLLQAAPMNEIQSTAEHNGSDSSPVEGAPASSQSIDSLINQVMLFAAYGNVASAILALDKIVRVYPEYWLSRIERGRLNFKLGRFLNGIEDFEYFYKNRLPSQKGIFLDSEGKYRRLDGKRVLITSDSGLGDLILLVRYGILIKQQGGEVVIECPSQFHTLLNNSPWVDRCIENGAIDFDLDYRVPLHNLFGAFGTSATTIPTFPSYLTARPEKIEIWRNRFPRAEKLKIGINWRSANENSSIWTSYRSIELDLLLKAFDPMQVQLFCLQKEVSNEELDRMKEWGNISILSPFFCDLEDTAAAMASLDLVVSTCTMIPHLSGALGIPTYLLLSINADWRWGVSGEDTPWYPSAKLFRQNNKLGEWEQVVQAVKNQLDRLMTDGGTHY